MSKPFVHAESSARKFGGKPEDYMALHNLMDSSKGTIADSRHRALTHNSWFIAPGGPLELIFGVNITNSDGRLVSVRDLGEQHILEDFGNRFIPSAQDYLQEINVQEWMVRGKGAPPSFALIWEKTKTAIKRIKPPKPKEELSLEGKEVFVDGAGAECHRPQTEKAMEKVVADFKKQTAKDFLVD